LLLGCGGGAFYELKTHVNEHKDEVGLLPLRKCEKKEEKKLDNGAHLAKNNPAT
jgi:hypothetical protein